MEFRADGRKVTVFGDEGEVLVSITAQNPEEALGLRDKAKMEGWEAIKLRGKK